MTQNKKLYTSNDSLIKLLVTLQGFDAEQRFNLTSKSKTDGYSFIRNLPEMKEHVVSDAVIAKCLKQLGISLKSKVKKKRGTSNSQAIYNRTISIANNLLRLQQHLERTLGDDFSGSQIFGDVAYENLLKITYKSKCSKEQTPPTEDEKQNPDFAYLKKD